MASREIRWTLKATQDKLAIYEYWTNRNKSILYAQKLERLFNEVLKIAVNYPSAGIKTESIDIRIQIIKDFKIEQKKTYWKFLQFGIQDKSQRI